MATPKTPKAKQTNRWPRTEAIALRPADGKTYADLLGVIRSRVNPDKCGTEIRAVRKTKSGMMMKYFYCV